LTERPRPREEGTETGDRYFEIEKYLHMILEVTVGYDEGDDLA
jgi:hypothetical protein